MASERATILLENNITLEYELENLKKYHRNYTERELNAAVGLMMLYNSGTPYTQTTPVNEISTVEHKKSQPLQNVRKIPPEAREAYQENQHNRSLENRSTSTRVLLSTCRNILRDFLRNNN